MENKIAYLSLCLLLTSQIGCSSTNEKWHPLSEQKTQGISGIAVVNEKNFLVVHDNKKADEPRLGLVMWESNGTPSLKPITWCNKTNLPIDLEAITSVPNHDLNYLVLESKGKVTRIKLENNNQCKTLAQFDLPNATAKSNMEALALHCFSQQCVLVWAERGDDKQAAKLSWAKFDADKNNVAAQKTFEFFSNYPNVNRRSISDIAIDDKGLVWVASTSDTGDDGPFQSALYKLGIFSEVNSEIDWQPTNSVSIVADYGSENIKIEGITFTKDGLIMGTDDENKGSKVSIKID